MVLETKETKVNQDPMGIFKNCITGIKLCGISRFSQSALRSSMQHLCVVKQRNKMQAVSPVLAVMKLAMTNGNRAPKQKKHYSILIQPINMVVIC
jgi:hypothetical protein